MPRRENERVILPKIFLSPEEIRDTPLFFLAGPCRGGDEWQYKPTLQEFRKRVNDFLLVNPDRYEDGHPIFSYQAFGKEDHFENQTLWERYYLEQAGEKTPRGCIMFWLPCESKTNPRAKDSGPYGQDSYGEIAEWRGRMMYNKNIRLVIGAEEGFPGLRTIKRNTWDALGENFPFYSTLESTIEAAMRKAIHGF